MTTGQLCKKLRADVGLSQKELATAMGVSDYVIGTAESGKTYGKGGTAISEATAKKYKEYFGVDIFDLKEAEDKINEELSEKGTTDPTTEDAREIIGKHIGYDYTVDKFGGAKLKGVSEESLARMREEEDRNYIHELEKEVEELKASLASEKAHSDFYEKKFREMQNTLDEIVKKNDQLKDENYQFGFKYDELLGDRDALLEERDALREELSSCKKNDPEHDILFELLLRFYKDHTSKPE